MVVPSLAFSTPVAQPFPGLLATFKAMRARAQARNQLRNALEQYSDRHLAEIGLMRSDIPDVVSGRYGQ